MADQIILNDNDPNKSDIFKDFFKEASQSGGEYLERDITMSDADYEDLFTKIANHESVNSFNEFKTVVHDTFEGKLDSQVEKWESKLALDRARLNDVFGK